ncbi:kinase/pyrophosphorylase [Hyphococcus flavus]|uniref:Putative pyruvate, phosphate dikinase regulatory protein n=1 Tax=Hyphococcus flavus TaxID=1866326 RepID=A0AAF0CFS8_9PROT|nr:pyruvate, water dikinase regulatory protein [Hyphococcus flavus]WDI32756.1 kinase/pyrophosphorylase [Hyphococcus flavus]
MSVSESKPEEKTATRKKSAPLATFFHVHLVSDSTGETLNAMLKATASQFAAAKPLEHIYALIRSRSQMEKTLAEIEASPGLVLYTILNPELRRLLEIRCSELQTPAISVLDPLLHAFTDFLGLEQSLRPGAQHQLDDAYFKRIAALDYTLSHDDGQMSWDLEPADVVLVGVSRTSKTPTCMYLANRGVKAANVPLVPTAEPPAELFALRKPMVVGLVASPERLAQIRQSRLGGMNAENAAEDYSDLDEIRKEVLRAKRLFAKHRWPAIDVTRKSVEETAAAILTKLSARQNK